jgi:histidine triad (HIT) family protein
MNDADCLFCKFVSGELNADIVYETDKVLAFRDINPQAPTHVLIVPRKWRKKWVLMRMVTGL